MPSRQNVTIPTKLSVASTYVIIVSSGNEEFNYIHTYIYDSI